MNGRCETDPFDRAVDVCRICFGEYCWSCLVEGKGRQQPMCRECALIVGGLRPKAKPRVCGQKKTVKERREALREAREAPRQHGTEFAFFDTVDDDFGLPSDGDDGGSEPATEEVRATDNEISESPAVQRLISIRRAKRQAPGQSRSAAAATTPPADNQLAHKSIPATTGPPAPVSPAPAFAAGPANSLAPPPPETWEMDEPAEFRKPRPFVSDKYRADAGEPEPPIAEEPSAAPPPEPAVQPIPQPERDEPVHINDDPWGRTGPEVVSTAPLPKRRPDPKPIEASSEAPPGWTKAELPKQG